LGDGDDGPHSQKSVGSDIAPRRAEWADQPTALATLWDGGTQAQVKKARDLFVFTHTKKDSVFVVSA